MIFYLVRHGKDDDMRFEHVDEVEWRIVFLEKLHKDISVQVI